MSTHPLVSIVITCYNYEAYVGDAIESALSQDYQNIELIVINDGSTDGSDEVIKSYKKLHDLKYVSRKNKGIVATRNQALSLYSGEYLLQLDADDTIPENYISELVTLAQREKADLVYTDYVTFDAFVEKSSFPEYNYEMLKNGNYIHISCLLSRKCLEGRKFDESLSKTSHEDWDFYLGIAASGAKIVKCSSVRLNYRMHQNSRNNQLSVFEDRIKYTTVYKYIIDKQEKEKQLDFYYLVGRLFSGWYAELDAHSSEQAQRIIELEGQLSAVLNSRRYKIANTIGNKLSGATSVLKNTKHSAERKYKRAVNLPKDMNIELRYKSELKKLVKTKNNKAIILHLYYIDMWPYFSEKLEYMMETGAYDLIVNVPHTDRESRTEAYNRIKGDYPAATILYTPNQGRDVLSFLKISKKLVELEYDYILKLHSKKSPQRGDGKDWSDEIVSRLVANDGKKLESIEAAFSKEKTSIIGPAGSYVPLTTYYNDNQPKFHWLFSEIFGRSAADEVNATNFDYGFFAGTMFWVRLSAVKSIFDLPITVNHFPPESAQLDGTVAHALERLLSVVPEYSKMDIYEVNKTGVKKIPYKTEYIPEWSDYYHVEANRK